MVRRVVQSYPGTGKPEQIATVLEHEIRSGVLGFGDRLQSENELVQRFSVSRNTVRKGLEELSSRGLITTKVGIGSFVTFDGKPVDDSLVAGARQRRRKCRDADAAARGDRGP
ncbi:GntR family transcriptional regulator [Mesorhizobium sp. M1163]|uniref:GntR family transcriptional regulator n=1 Tax=Mesorhizobium sp. M1163 TaxID=2957065 RepID=UPI00333CCFDA